MDAKEPQSNNQGEQVLNTRCTMCARSRGDIVREMRARPFLSLTDILDNEGVDCPGCRQLFQNQVFCLVFFVV